MNDIIAMTELTLDSDLNRSQRESLLLVHGLARSLLLIIYDVLDISKSVYIMDARLAVTLQTHIFHTITLLLYNSRSCSHDHGGRLVLPPSNRLRHPENPGRSRLKPPTITWTPPTTYSRTFLINSFVIHCRKSHIAPSTRLLALVDQSVTLEFCVTDTGIGIATLSGPPRLAVHFFVLLAFSTFCCSPRIC